MSRRSRDAAAAAERREQRDAARAQDAVDEYERGEEEELVGQAMGKVAAGGTGAAGLEGCLLAADGPAGAGLLVQAGASAPRRAGRARRRGGRLQQPWQSLRSNAGHAA